MQFPIPFTKMSGAGNDFILIDHRQPIFPDQAAIQGFARAVCERKFSVGADGLILIEESPEADFRWQFFNADGSIAEMCGNGARCAARFAHRQGIAPARMRFATLAGIIEAEVSGAEVSLTMTPPVDLRLDPRPIAMDGTEHPVYFINTGVPHAVVPVAEIEAAAVAAWGRLIRFHPLFQPAGANVNFVQFGPAGENRLDLRTYERGVEAETLACGTGAVAVAIIAGLLGKVTSPVRVRTSGQEELTIHYQLRNGAVSDVRLQGPADFIYDGQLHAEAIRRLEPNR